MCYEQKKKFSTVSASAVRRSRAQESRKSQDGPLISITASEVPQLPQAATSVTARRQTSHSSTKKGRSYFSLQKHLPTLLISYTHSCNSIYDLYVVSSKTKLSDQIPIILNEIKEICRRYKTLRNHSPNQSLVSECVISNLTKSNSKQPPGSSLTALQSGVIERVLFLITILFPPSSNHFVSEQALLAQPNSRSMKEFIVTPKERRKLWRALMCNTNNTFPMLLSAARTDLMCAPDPHPAALLLSLLYNLFQALRGKPILKKVIELCIMLGLYKICTNILMVHTSTQVFSVKGDGTSEVQLYYRCRVIEAVALIMTLTSHFHPKGHIVIRLTCILERLLYSLGVLVDLLDIRLRDFLDALSSLDDLDKSINKEEARERLLQLIKSAVRSTSFLCSACTHLSMSIFSAAKSSNNANDLGARCVGVCAKLIALLSSTLYLEIPSHLYQVFTTQSNTPLSLCKLPEGFMGNEASHHEVPSWVLLWSRGLEVSMFWAVALLQRVCKRTKAKITCSIGAHKHNTLLSLYTVLWVITQEIGKGVENCEASGKNQTPTAFSQSQLEHQMCIIHTTLITIDTLLRANRKLGLEELNAVGGVASLVKLVLQLPLVGVDQWCHCYILCCSFYGLSLLPSCSENESAYTVNSRVPTFTLPNDNETYRCFTPEAKTLSISQSNFVMEAASSEDVPIPEKGFDISDLISPVGKLPFTDTLDLLPVDQCPSWFSTELNNGFIPPKTEMPLENSVELPWPFTDPPLPPTTYCPHHPNDEPVEPLEVLSNSQRIDIIMHHIKRLLYLNRTSDDANEDSTHHHRYRVVYDRTRDVEKGETTAMEINESTFNDNVVSDSLSNAKTLRDTSSLTFRSNFPSGNLQRAIFVSEDEYDLILSWDTGTNSFTQWFCFSVSDYEPGKTYRFNIINMEKSGSLFNEGQRVLMLHDTFTESFSFPYHRVPNTSKPSRWLRAGEFIYYFPNPYGKPTRLSLRNKLPLTSSCSITLTRPTNQPAEAKPKKQVQRSRHIPLYMHQRRDTTPKTASKKSSLASSHAVLGKKASPSLCAEGGANEGFSKTYFTLSFTITMPTEVPYKVYIANCFPYTYSEVLGQLRRLSSAAHTDDTTTTTTNNNTSELSSGGRPAHFTIQQLCRTPGGLPVPFVTATALYSLTERRRYTPEEIRWRPVILLTARVHPGESNSSWVMHGILEALLAPVNVHTAHNSRGNTTDAEGLHQVVNDLLHHFVFKIIPILNPDGVVMGNHRCSIFGVDLNRDFLNPDAKSNPVVYSLKQLLRHMITTEQRSVILYTDFHGHSRAKNFMIYGCTEEAISSLKKKRKEKNDFRKRRWYIAFFHFYHYRHSGCRPSSW
ncbi:unnamed protein product [Phytomonas sp. Hart1]|nr:unnamed protein product [Phytomonas sp. Hart1]|eukprot:CCW66131.1 unnamed protein product [Phytomonas sp. isolate Hart1]